MSKLFSFTCVHLPNNFFEFWGSEKITKISTTYAVIQIQKKKDKRIHG